MAFASSSGLRGRASRDCACHLYTLCVARHAQHVALRGHARISRCLLSPGAESRRTPRQ